MKKKVIALCGIIVTFILCTGTIIFAASDVNIFFQAGQFLKEALTNNDNITTNNNVSILAKYGETPITADIVQYHKNMNVLRSDESAADHQTDIDVVNRIIESMILLEEAERRGLSATEEEIAGLVNGAIEAYSLPAGKEILDPFLEGAGITFDEYITMLRAQAPRTIARQKLIDAIGREYCEENGLEFTKINPPAELAAAQEAYIKELFEQNKHKITYYIDVPST